MPVVDLGALQSAEYVVLSASSELTDERILTAGGGISIVDGGAGNAVTISVSAAGIDHGGLSGLGDDDHTIYALLAGRAGGQTLIGGTADGDDLILQSTAHANRGTIFLPDDTMIGDAAVVPDNTLHIHKATAGAIIAVATAPLVVENDNSAFIQIMHPAGNEGGLLIGDPTDNISGAIIVNTGNDMEFRAGGNVTRMLIASDGGIFMYNLLAAAASTDVNINGANELHSVTSSRRFKKQIKSLDARFDSKLIYDLEPKSFVWRKNTGSADMVDFGIIAEDAYEVMPELVNLDPDGRPWSIRYSPLTVLMLAEIQRLRQLLEPVH
jgi:hypothetical protein